jgi:thioredoxin-related protein
MRFLSIVCGGFLLLASSIWETDIEQATKKARDEHKLILVNFSGSDWCGPCIMLRKNVFENTVFTNFADSNLVLVNADFPRLSKNKLQKEQQKKNDKLADKYNSKGIFPLTLLLDKSGKIIKQWEGNPGLSAEQFTQQIRILANAGK